MTFSRSLTSGLMCYFLMVAAVSAGATNEARNGRLRGVSRSSAEYACVQNNGIFEGPVDDNAIQSMKTWNINVVRIPLNEDCWLGINGHNPLYSGPKYQEAVKDYVQRLRNHDLNVILDLHWSDGHYYEGNCQDYSAKCQKPMPDKINAPTFWKSVASTFKNDDGVIFDIFNEPFPDRLISDSTQAWKCLRDGGSACPWIQFEAVGMQDLVNAVRSTGAQNLIMVPGLSYTNDLSRWLEFVPEDSANNIAASWHSYDFNACNYKDCWDREIAPIADKYTVIVGEIGQEGCAHNYVDQLMPWLDERNMNYLGWTWNNWDCSSGPALISDYNGTPTNFGVAIRDRFKKGAAVSTGATEEARNGQLRGVSRSSAEYACVQNNGIFEGPVDDNAIQSMKTWNINVVRIPLNEDCWLGINGHNPLYSGPKYQEAVKDYVQRLRNHDLNVILDLHWSDGHYYEGNCQDYSAKCQKPMPDKINAPTFWKSVASTFKNDDGVIFDIFNEPFPDRLISDSTQAWKCLRDGGSACPWIQFEAVGMQDLVNAVRSTGAQNLIMVPGLSYTNDLSRWLEFVPEDSANNIAASWHSYDFNACNYKDCWDREIAPIADKYTVIVGEIGQEGCAHNYVDQLMPWLDERNMNYLGWTWNNWDCSSGPALISDYNGTPTNFGVAIRDRFKKA